MKSIKSIDKAIERANNAYNTYLTECDKVCCLAQEYVNWGQLRCEYIPADGLCLGIVSLNDDINIPNYLSWRKNEYDVILVPARLFFLEKENMTFENFCLNAI